MRKRTNAKWKKEFWKVFSLYIRTRDKFVCFTCDRRAFGSAMHAGHFIPASTGGLSLYFHDKNVHAQCYHCNINLGGYGAMYHKRMLEKYGKREVEKLWELKGAYRKISNQEYEELIETYKRKTARLLAE